jgi:hypothetical protein
VLTTITINQDGRAAEISDGQGLEGFPEHAEPAGIRQSRPHVTLVSPWKQVQYQRVSLRCRCGAEYVVHVDRVLAAIGKKRRPRGPGKPIDIFTNEITKKAIEGWHSGIGSRILSGMASSITTGIEEVTEEKVRENRVRRMAERQRLQLVKSRRRDPKAYDFGRYWLHDQSGEVVVGGDDGTNLDEIERWLTR